MRFFYKLLSLTSLLFLVLFFSCSNPKSHQVVNNGERKVCVLSTIAMIDDLVGMVGGDRIDHSSLISGEIDPHSYEIVKGDDERISDADLLFYNGLGLEHGASLCYKIQNHPFSLAVADEIARTYPERILYSRGCVDPHVWMDISLWVKAIDPILDSLVKLDPEGESYYRARAFEAKEKMLATHQRLYTALQSVPSSRRYLVTSHDAFGYFARGYLADLDEVISGQWRDRFAAPEGLAPDGQLSSRDIQMIMDHLDRFDIGVVFAESNVSQDSLKKIVLASREKKREVIFSKRVLYGDAMGSFDHPIASYLDMIEQNAQSLLIEWQSQ